MVHSRRNLVHFQKTVVHRKVFLPGHGKLEKIAKVQKCTKAGLDKRKKERKKTPKIGER